MLVAQSCQTLCHPMNCTPPGSSVHGLLQARILEWVVIPFSHGSSLTQGSNAGLLYCRQIIYGLNYQGSPQLRLKERKRRVGFFLGGGGVLTENYMGS